MRLRKAFRSISALLYVHTTILISGRDITEVLPGTQTRALKSQVYAVLLDEGTNQPRRILTYHTGLAAASQIFSAVR